MNVVLSRHAKRRGKLYGISKATINNILKNRDLSQGKHEIVETVEGFTYPIKIVIEVRGETVTVITNYPLKKGGKR